MPASSPGFPRTAARDPGQAPGIHLQGTHAHSPNLAQGSSSRLLETYKESHEETGQQSKKPAAGSWMIPANMTCRCKVPVSTQALRHKMFHRVVRDGICATVCPITGAVHRFESIFGSTTLYNSCCLLHIFRWDTRNQRLTVQLYRPSALFSSIGQALCEAR